MATAVKDFVGSRTCSECGGIYRVDAQHNGRRCPDCVRELASTDPAMKAFCAQRREDRRTPIGPLERRMLERQTLTVHRVDGPATEAEQERQWAQQDAEDCERAARQEDGDGR